MPDLRRSGALGNRQTWAAVVYDGILKDNGMAKKDLVKFTVFLTDPRHIEIYRAARKKVIGDATIPASTLLVVNGLASPDMLIEIEALAAKG